MTTDHYIQKYYTKLPPQHNLIEEILLGGIITNCNVLTLAKLDLEIEYFAIDNNKLIYTIIIEIHEKYKYVDSIILINTLWELNLLHEVGGIQKILNLMKQGQVFLPIFTANKIIKYYIDTIKNKYFRRLLIQYGYFIIKLAHISYISNYTIASKADKYLNRLGHVLKKHESQEIPTILTNFLLHLKTNQTIEYEKGLMSGFTEIDQITGGFKNSDLIIIAGRPSMGKTSFALSIISNIINLSSSNTKIKVGIFSLETSTKQILYKLLSITAHIPLNKLLTGYINQNEWITIQKTSACIINSISYIDDTANLSIDHLHSKTKLIKNKHSTINLIVIDYLQLIQSEKTYLASRTEELAVITRSLKILAKDLHIPIIVLSQLNRNVESRVNKKPLLSDLRESGCVSSNNHLITNKKLSLYFYPYEYINISTNKSKINFISLQKYQIVPKIQQYTYEIHNYISNVLTHNHLILAAVGWKKNDNFKYYELTLYENHKNYQSKLCYNSIKYIKLNEKETVYDIENNEYKNFHSKNKLVLHNSIEQDADLVLLLYREAYYNYNTQNITDVIIAKHRNGRTGTAQLNFDTRLATFENKQE
uniref:Replicative DNA helicase n=1 Tax=Kumanoa americana TaxID=1196377 RepID=A0A1C9CGR5_9FLOR|nr:replication helicase subunit [Kumanoa americana]AOM67590.1 replication helicase subunit [Kumanoa americana]